MRDPMVHSVAWAAFLLGCAWAPPAERPEPAEADRAVTMLAPAEAAREAIAPRDPGPPRLLELALVFPDPGTIFSAEPEAFLAGSIDATFGVAGPVDAVIVIDASTSTARSADATLKNAVRDRVRGRRSPGSDLTILRAELDSARFLLEDVDPRDARIGIVAFSAADRYEPAQPQRSAWTEVPLTRQLDALTAGLQRIDRKGAAGGTDMARGLDLAVDELIGRGRSRPKPDARKVVVFFTDGTPTEPYPRADDNEWAVIRAAERAAAHGVRVFSFAVGPEAFGRPIAAVEMARRTGGVFTPVRAPRDLTEAVRSVGLTGLEELEVRNVGTATSARRIRLDRDGSFDALVPLSPGRNTLRVRVVVGGVTAVAEREVHYAPGSARPFLPPVLEERRARLARLGERQVEVDTDADAALLETIARDRALLEKRARRQLKELVIDVAAPPPEPTETSR
jgi:hypothetical protein